MAKVFTDANFEQEVLKSDLPVLVDFYADWCGPCQMMGPVIDKLAEEYEGKFNIGKVNVDQNGTTAQAYKVMSIPTLLFFKNGEVVDKVMGAVAKATLEQKIKMYM